MHCLNKFARQLFALLFLFAIPHQVSALHELYEFEGTQRSDYFGRNVAALGDVNCDGFPDIGIGADHHSRDGVVNAGKVDVRSGKNGQLLYALTGDAESWELFGWTLGGIGDIDGDGCADIAVTAMHGAGASPWSGRVYVFSGRTAQRLYRLLGATDNGQLGRALATLPDMNSDGVPDFLVAEPGGGASHEGAVHLVSGIDGSYLATVNGPSANSSFGSALAVLPDIDNDGVTDYTVGASNAAVAGDFYRGVVQVYSGASHTVMFAFSGQEAGDYFGTALSRAGDIDQDGTEDIAIGAMGVGSVSHPYGYVQIRSGANGDPLQLWTGGRSNGHFGWAVALLGDLNADSIPDLAVSEPLGAVASPTNPQDTITPGLVALISGADGSQLATIEGEDSDELGTSLAVDDFNGDGNIDLLLGTKRGGDNEEVSGIGLAKAYDVVTVPPAKSTVSGSLSSSGDLTLEVVHPSVDSSCRYRLRVAPRITSRSGRQLKAWSSNATHNSFQAATLPLVKGRDKRIGFGLDRRCGSERRWRFLSRVTLSFGGYANSEKPRGRGRVIELIRRRTRAV